MIKRSFDIVFSAIALLLVAPLMVVAALGVRFASPGPVLFRARRAGQGGTPFTMYKFRTMHVASKPAHPSRITAANDPRVFRLGSLLRKLKIDELPQFFNVLIGDLSVVGPRPEDPEIIEAHYSKQDLETLAVKPGLVSPGSLFNYTHGDLFLAEAQAEDRYASELLPIKLAMERIYVQRASLAYDLLLIVRTVSIIAQRLLGRERFPLPPEADALDKGLETKLETWVVTRI